MRASTQCTPHLVVTTHVCLVGIEDKITPPPESADRIHCNGRAAGIASIGIAEELEMFPTHLILSYAMIIVAPILHVIKQSYQRQSELQHTLCNLHL